MNRKIVRLFLLSLILFSGVSLAASGELKPYKGTLASPPVELMDLEGRMHKLSDYRGNIVLLHFWATYCAPCRKEMPTMNRLIKKMQGKAFKLLTVNMAEPEAEVRKFIDELKVDFTVLLDKDGEVLSRWKVFAAPVNFLLDKEGRIIYTLYGGVEWDSHEMVNKLTALAE